jgi:hypothetical protein
MSVSVVDPVGEAIKRTSDILFKPFDLGKWFVLGFCAFLAYLGEGGGTWWWPGGDDSDRTPDGDRGWRSCEQAPCFESASAWIQENLIWIIGGAVVGFVIIAAIGALVLWLASRGKFMFLDGLVHNRGAVVEPWRVFRNLGNSLFGFLFFIRIMGLLSALLAVAIGTVIAWPSIQAQEFGAPALTALVVGGLLLLIVVIVFAVISFLLEHLVVPTMYLRHDLVMPSWTIVRQDLLAGHVGTIVLFFLMKFVLSIAIGAIAVGLTCATCCLAALPYLGTVILLPLLVFNRCYSLCFIEQFGPEWRFFSADNLTNL